MVVPHFHTSLSEPTPASWGSLTGHVYPANVWQLGDGAHSSGSPFWDGPSSKGLQARRVGVLPQRAGWHNSLTGCPRVAQVRQPRLGEPSGCQAGSAPTGLLTRNSTTLRRGGGSGNFPASQLAATKSQTSWVKLQDRVSFLFQRFEFCITPPLILEH